MVTRTLERLDGAASTIVPLAYLAALLFGTLAYFSGIAVNLGLAVGVALAIACELHSFLEQRRVRSLWAAIGRSGDPEARSRLAGQLRAHVAILAALVAFSAVNATAFAASSWHPSPGFLPTWLQIGIRGGVVPVLFLLTGALSPLTVNAGDELAAASRHMLHKAIRATTRQWGARIETARRTGTDLAPVAVSLLLDAGDHDGARRLRLISDGLTASERGSITQTVTLEPVESPHTRAPEALLAPEPASPAPVRTPKRKAAQGHPRASAGRIKLVSASAEQRCRDAYRSGMTITGLMSAAGVSRSAASKYRRLLISERAQQQEVAE